MLGHHHFANGDWLRVGANSRCSSEVCQARVDAELLHHGGNLAAVMGLMIEHLQHQLPAWVGERSARNQALKLQRPGEPLGCQFGGELAGSAIHLTLGVTEFVIVVVKLGIER